MEQVVNHHSPIRSELASDDSSFAGLLIEFANSLPQRLKKMDAALRSADFDALRAAAHQLKGIGGGYGYPVLTEKARKLECHAMDHAIDDCLDTYEELRAICSQIVVISP
ncbi:MAG: Hpt domain-containing protein [Planctomycetes bacterium]|nr:Hpt domain-containing protein [Planctomycetota bacterium]MBI3835784.1 Hpt domain-containing protein [Planctomycetota bacterium]